MPPLSAGGLQLITIYVEDLETKSKFLGIPGARAVIILAEADEKSDIPAKLTALILN